MAAVVVGLVDDERNSRALSEIAGGLASTQTMVDATLAGRQEKLAALLDNLTASSGSFDVLLKRFADTVEESFTKYEGFVRVGPRRGFHLLLVQETDEGFTPILG